MVFLKATRICRVVAALIAVVFISTGVLAEQIESENIDIKAPLPNADNSIKIESKESASREKALAELKKIKKEINECLNNSPTKLVSNDYKIAKQDILFISVWENDDLTTETIVRPDGKISFPLIGDVAAEGNTITELDKRITEALKKFIRKPEVSIVIKEFARKKATILGGVVRPGVENFVVEARLLDIIAQAGGFSKEAVLDSVLLIRGNGDNPKINIVNANGLIEGKNFEQNVSIEENDVIYVPINTGIVVLGQVVYPGVYKPEGESNVLKAIALAGGFTNDAVLNSVVIIRPKPESELFLVNLNKAILKADPSQNIMLKPGDIIYVSKKFIADINYLTEELFGPLLDQAVKVQQLNQPWH